jgi:hypothetical protein
MSTIPNIALAAEPASSPRRIALKRFLVEAQRHDDGDGYETDSEIDRTTNVVGASPADKICERNLDKAKPNYGDHHPRYSRRYDPFDPFDELTDADFDDGADEAKPEDQRQHLLRPGAARFGDEACRDDRPDKGKTRPLHAEEARPNRPDAAYLDKRTNTRGNQRHGNEIGCELAETQCSADNQRRSHDRNETCQDMLDSSERARKEWRALFKAIKQIRRVTAG